MKNIGEDILQTLRGLSGVNIDFLEFVEENPEALKRSSFSELVAFDIGPRNVQPWPTFVSRKMKQQLEQTSTAVFHLIKQIPARLFDNDTQQIADYFGFNEEYTQLQLESVKGGHLDNLLARGDFIINSQQIKCLEFNVSAAIGGWQLPILETLYLKNPIIAKFSRQYRVKVHNKNQHIIFLRHLLNTARKKFPTPLHREINIAVVIPHYENDRETNIIQEHLNRLWQELLEQQDTYSGGSIIFCTFSHLNDRHDCIFYKDKPINSVVEWHHGKVPLEILYVSLMGNVILYNGPITTLLSNKLNLALLSENQDTGIFTSGESEIIKAHIPWTRRILPGQVTYNKEKFSMEDFLRSRREKLVIKPVHELGGTGISVGRYISPEQWEKVVKKALMDEYGDWIVQQYIEPLTHLYQYGEEGYAEHQTIWGLFTFGTEYAGGFLRLMPKNANSKGIINTYQGASKTVIFEVDG
jgi:hypothetical protein